MEAARNAPLFSASFASLSSLSPTPSLWFFARYSRQHFSSLV
ncbi:hypothetical protein C4K22_2487 [Pseudomonas chlororaphis subsp. aurantiaca]|jgi:hypothetical protein|nr:hypothetical protein C4K24_2375 [Pseudomonas chlororaphis subsp. aurantiaca]AZD35230.1 hypothetical protein C4K22_2487 [Pseudomonas chlororaphis subsp. aurantiaca]AZD41564.1 hypothetical protein C4K21_2490 [Pseudomonas chlororaphis subsp. aurantiaca]AZD78956.1 hypothetical protein C4K15_2389 [Pseudomonas chlororaphis subsp. aurantiaca]